VKTGSFDLSPRGSVRAAALCVHGLTSTPAEVRPVAEVLAQRGIRALGPSLPGHSRSPEELARVEYGAWLEAVRSECDKLHAEHESVFLVGSSLGGLLALALAAERPVDGLAVVGVPLDFGWHRSWIPALLRHVRAFVPKRGGSDIRDEAARERHVSYPVMPVASVHQLILLQRVVRRCLAQVDAPLLVAYGRHDSTASPQDAETIFAGVASVEREHVVLQNSAHIATLDHDGPQLCEAIARFFHARIE
jgi:carboxylesterase